MSDSLPLSNEIKGMDELIGQQVVIDTDSNFVYLGILEAVHSHFIRLSEVDAHEATEVGVSKERYIHEAKGMGIRANRKFTWVNLARVVSISRVEDVEGF